VLACWRACWGACWRGVLGGRAGSRLTTVRPTPSTSQQW
jgi:hypothetical protein